MSVTAETVAAIASIITSLVVIFGAIFAVYRWYLHQEKQDKDIKAIKREQTMLVYAMQACLDGLQQLGATHVVPEAKDKLSKYINQQAHDQLDE